MPKSKICPLCKKVFTKKANQRPNEWVRKRWCSRRCSNKSPSHAAAVSRKSKVRVRPRRPLAERLWAKIDVRGPDECWLFTGTADENGYGSIRNVGCNISAHRAALIVSGIKIPDGMCVCHHCDNPPCCNPRHLFVGTHQDNMDDKVKKKRQGIRRNAKLTMEKAREIRAASGTRRAVAARFGVSAGVVNAIIWNVAWKE